MDEDTKSAERSHSALLNTLVIVSVVALGVVAAGLTTPAEEPELTSLPETSVTPTPEPPQQEYVYVTPEVDPSASIPGCDTVEASTEPSYSSLISTGEESYDNPSAPWYSGPKAHLMSEALMAALPSNISASKSLYFGPIPTSEGQDFVLDSANASVQLSRGENPEYLSVGVGPRDSAEPPACVAGQLDERRTMPDGTVVDTDDTWSETNGARTYTRMATAYHADRSTVSVYLAGGDDENAFTLALDDLVRVATDPNCESQLRYLLARQATSPSAAPVGTTVHLPSSPPTRPLGSMTLSGGQMRRRSLRHHRWVRCTPVNSVRGFVRR